jgi:hypothetical protein
MTYGIKVSKPGKDISSTDPNDFVMNSEWGTIKFLAWGGTTATVNGSTSLSVTVTHNAGFFPIVMLYVELTPSSGRWYAAPFTDVSGEDTFVSGLIDDTYSGVNSFTFQIVNKTGSQKIIHYYYYIIGETGK